MLILTIYCVFSCVLVFRFVCILILCHVLLFILYYFLIKIKKSLKNCNYFDGILILIYNLVLKSNTKT